MMKPNQSIDRKVTTEDVLKAKLTDAQIPGFVVECSPDEAQMAGAFKEDALNEQDALDSQIDLAEMLDEV